ncbi:hypothetical protein LVJ94_39815 [Pendulispora rubella]|uniref:Flp pilus-assembly TadG-like N-terminal domain-containing protein n=1 Tax=Pendulispora rubella TaxID=2741070 RepID=A0ABZ2L325_9BACT
MLASERCIAKPSLKDDQRGAIMLMGLFMALSLVASLWFLIGIGQAIIFRDRGQEAADAMAFSVAAVDARGMDLIAVLNVIMLALVSIYLLIQLVADAMIASIIFSPEGEAVDRANQGAVKGVLTVALPTIATAQTVIAVATPWVGTLMIAPQVASHYQGFEKSGPFAAFGLQNIPGAGFSTGKAATFDKSKSRKDKAKEREGEEPLSAEDQAERDRADKAEERNGVLGTIRLGLPVAYEPNDTLCIRAFVFVPDIIADLFHLPSPVKWAIDIVLGGAGELYAKRACKGAPWDWPGPKKMAGGNLSPQTQVYGFSNGDFQDKWERKVKLGGPRAQWGGGDGAAKEHSYNAQAEFYYDCKGRFFEADCNGQTIGATSVGKEHALYSIGWKARLMKYKSPGQLLFENLVNSTVSNGVGLAFDGMAEGLKKIGVPDAVVDKAKNMGRKAYDSSDIATQQVPKVSGAIKNAGKEFLDEANNYH